nr:triple gene block protein 1 [Wheat yellow stripe virus]
MGTESERSSGQFDRRAGREGGVDTNIKGKEESHKSVVEDDKSGGISPKTGKQNARDEPSGSNPVRREPVEDTKTEKSDKKKTKEKDGQKSAEDSGKSGRGKLDDNGPPASDGSNKKEKKKKKQDVKEKTESRGKDDKSSKPLVPLSSWARENPDDFFSILEMEVKEAGYTWHDLAPARTSWEKLKESGATDNYIDLLTNESFDKPCRNGQDVSAIKLSKTTGSDVPNEWSCRIGLVIGSAGSGKSTLIKKIMDEKVDSRAVLALPNKHLLTGVYSGRLGVFLIDDLFTREVEYSKYRTMIIDEFTRVHMCEILVLAAILGVKNVVCFGDPGQNLNFKAGSVANYNFPVLASSYTAHRYGEATADILNKCNGGGKPVVGNKGVKDEWTFEELMGKIQEMSTILTASEQSRAYLLEDDIEAQTWDEVQGQTFDVVTIFLFDEYDDELICDPNVRTVLLTRARKGGVFRFGDKIRARFGNGDFAVGGKKCFTGDTLCDER